MKQMLPQSTRRSQLCRRLDSGLPVSRTVREELALFEAPGLRGFVRAASANPYTIPPQTPLVVQSPSHL